MNTKKLILQKKDARRERGATMVEYALLVALLAVAVAAVLPNFATSITGLFGRVGDELDATLPANN